MNAINPNDQDHISFRSDIYCSGDGKITLKAPKERFPLGMVYDADRGCFVQQDVKQDQLSETVELNACSISFTSISDGDQCLDFLQIPAATALKVRNNVLDIGPLGEYLKQRKDEKSLQEILVKCVAETVGARVNIHACNTTIQTGRGIDFNCSGNTHTSIGVMFSLSLRTLQL